MKKITSLDNSAVKKIASLKYKKYRDQENLFVVEGLKNAKDILKTPEAIKSLIFLCLSEDNQELLDEKPFSECREKALILSEEIIKSLTDTSTSQGVFLVLTKPSLDISADLSSYSSVLILDQVSDPGNAGTMIRTALAANFDAVISLKGTVDLYNPKVVRSAMGAITKIPLYFADDFSQLHSLFKRFGFKVIAADLTGDFTIYNIPTIPKFGLLMGSEDSGIHTEAECIDYRVSIPMNADAESLNVAVAAGILMYSLSRDCFI